ncbi:MAG: Flp family type IVb pilin [Alphaproteobacteria bacterium]
MEKVRHMIAVFAKDESGAAAAEYALIIGAVSLLIVAGALVLGQGISDFFTTLGTWFKNLTVPTPTS